MCGPTRNEPTDGSTDGRKIPSARSTAPAVAGRLSLLRSAPAGSGSGDTSCQWPINPGWPGGQRRRGAAVTDAAAARGTSRPPPQTTDRWTTDGLRPGPAYVRPAECDLRNGIFIKLLPRVRPYPFLRRTGRATALLLLLRRRLKVDIETRRERRNSKSPLTYSADVTIICIYLLPARRRPQGLVIIGVCLCALFCPQDISRTGS